MVLHTVSRIPRRLPPDVPPPACKYCSLLLASKPRAASQPMDQCPHTPRCASIRGRCWETSIVAPHLRSAPQFPTRESRAPTCLALPRRRSRRPAAPARRKKTPDSRPHPPSTPQGAAHTPPPSSTAATSARRGKNAHSRPPKSGPAPPSAPRSSHRPGTWRVRRHTSAPKVLLPAPLAAVPAVRNRGGCPCNALPASPRISPHWAAPLPRCPLPPFLPSPQPPSAQPSILPSPCPRPPAILQAG